MEAKNYMEKLVFEKLDAILSQHPNFCNCEQCKKDVAVIALNHLPPKYIATEKGDIFFRLEESNAATSVRVIEEITRAIEVVSSNPHHEAV